MVSDSLTTNTRRRRAVLAAILLSSLLLNTFHLQWGLPNGNTTWAADAITPMTPLAVARKTFAGRNSGWFYFKYPIGHPLLLLAAYAPYLGALYATHQFARPQSAYPYGFKHPERALSVLALIGRALSVLMATACVAIVYMLGALWFEPAVGLVAAAGATTSMGLVFYAHTTNLDVPVMFWMLFALLCAVRLMETVHWAECLGLGVAAAMGLATKETAVGIIITLPVFIVVAHGHRVRSYSAAMIGSMLVRLMVGAVVGLVVFGCATNAFYNPAGLLNRLRYLTGTLPREYFGTLVPRAAYIETTSGPSLATHLRLLRELSTAMVDVMGVALCTAGLAGLVLALVWRPRVMLQIAVLTVAFYWFTLASLPLVAVRYILPLAMLLMIFAGAFFVAVSRLGKVATAAVAVVLLTSVAYGASVDYALRHDPRYTAEMWLRQHARGRTVEVYNRATFLPRFPEDVNVSRPKFTKITQQGVSERRPDFILLNMADVGRVTGHYDVFEVGVKRRAENVAFLDALLNEQLGYHRIARFRTHVPLIRDGVIRSLNPEIVVFERS